MKTFKTIHLWANTRVSPYVLCLSLISYLSSLISGEAQNVAINSSGNQADPSAMLDVASTSAGVLIPRMTTAQRSAISSPAIGLQIYNTDCGELNYWNGSCWLSSSASLPAPYSITGVTTACIGATGVTYSAPGVSGAAGYNWSVPAYAIITAGQGTTAITVTFGSGPGQVCVNAYDACETSPQTCINVGVSNGPSTPGSIAGITSVCTNSTAVTYSVSPVLGATSYTWSLPAGATGSSTTNSITINFTGATAGSALLCVAANNSCGAGSSSCLTIAISPLPANAGTISGSSSVCVNQSNVTYSVPSISNSAASGYVWAYSGSGATISGSGNTVTLNFSSVATSGNLTVMGTNSCGNGTVSANYPITVNPVPIAAGTITGTATVCQGARAVSYSVTSITGATSYTWSYSGSGDTLSGTTNPVTINFSSAATAGSLTVSGTNSCGNGTASAAYPIAVNQLPGGTGTISGTSVVCQNQSGVAYSVSGISGATSYTWGYTGTGATITGTTNSVTVSFSGSATAGNITVSGTNSCGSGTQATFAVAISPPSLSAPGSIGGNSSVCTSGVGTYFVSPVTGATSYTWTFTGSGASISGTTNQVDISFSNSATSGNLSVTANNGCGASASSATFAITVNTTPVSTFSYTPAPPVVGSLMTFTPTDATNQLYFWTFPGPVFSTATNPPVYTWTLIATNNVTLTVTKNGCNSTTNVTITPPTNSNSAHGTASFSYNGSYQTWTVPSGVTSAILNVSGAQGYSSSAGMGGQTIGALAVTAGQTLYINIGGQGAAATGGFNGGGSLTSGTNAGGGGASDVRVGSNSYSNVVIVAGGGGGNGGYNGGCGGCGTTGTSGNNQYAGGGGGTGWGGNGTNGGSSGGAGGTAAHGWGGGGGGYTSGGGYGCATTTGNYCGTAGTQGQGGNGNAGDYSCYSSVGAGGGGYYGGGGSSAGDCGGGSGGGGSSVTIGLSGASFVGGNQSGNGKATITW